MNLRRCLDHGLDRTPASRNETGPGPNRLAEALLTLLSHPDYRLADCFPDAERLVEGYTDHTQPSPPHPPSSAPRIKAVFGRIYYLA